MNSDGIVIAFYVRKYVRLCLPSCLIMFSMDQFLLQCSKKAFHWRVVEDITLVAYADYRFLSIQQLSVLSAGILDTTVRMMQQYRFRPAVSLGHLQGFTCQQVDQIRFHRPTNNPSCIKFQHDGQVDPPPGRCERR